MSHDPKCGRCGHSVKLHGRRGHGACHAPHELTDRGRAALADISTSTAGQPLIVQRATLETALALPGMTVGCTCRRFRLTPEPAATLVIREVPACTSCGLVGHLAEDCKRS